MEIFSLPATFIADGSATIVMCITAVITLGVILVAFRFGKRVLGF